KDEEAFKQDINRSAAVGAKFHNMMIWAKHADGHYVTNEEVAKTYIDFYTYAQSKGITVTLECHVDNWSEDYRRVIPVADLIE
ncbi:hypothetical protein WAJ05_21465, partial [Acinetobacter baumannii]